jgi:nickel/cobalt exporter
MFDPLIGATPVQDHELSALLITAATIGTLHTLMGPDHYLPFIAIARARQWTIRRTLVITSLCGVGHVLSSIVIGALGLLLGWAVLGMESFEAIRGNIAGWLLIGFGAAYLLWGIRRAIRNKPHSHVHVHEDGTIHTHEHTHHGEHAHVHDHAPAKQNITPWVLFIIFVFGPCEPLIPVLMAPAAESSAWGVALVAGTFALCTIGTMLVCVMLALAGLSRFRLPNLERYAHAMAGFIVLLCGLAIQLGL